MRRSRLVLVGIAVLLGLGAGLYGLAGRGGAAEPPWKVVEASAGEITEKAVAVGQIQPRQKFSIKSKIPGIVRRCMVEVGQPVSAGDPLFEIAPDPTPLELTEQSRRVEAAQATFERAKAELDRVEELQRQGITPPNDYDQKREAFELARIALLKARQDRELIVTGKTTGAGALESVLRAPAAGTILTRAVSPGDPVVPLTSYQPGTELASIADMADLVFKGTVDEIDVGKLATGLRARIKVGALPEDVVTGKVARIAPQAQQKDGATLFDVEIELDPSPALVLRAGYSANADIIIREKKDVIVVPERLVTFEEDGKKAFVELVPGAGETSPRKVEVKLGISDGMSSEVVSGIEKGARLVERPPKEIS